MAEKRFRPGEKATASGQYQVGRTQTERTIVRDKPFPPTPKPGQGYRLVDPTNNKSGHRK